VVDVFTKAQRSAVMARVRSRGTKPEIAVRDALKRAGYKPRLHPANLPGRPDIVLGKYCVAIFINGCFWHQHVGCEAASKPRSNQQYWNRKLASNVRRDRRNVKALRQLGFRVIVIWECQLRGRKDLSRYIHQRIGSPRQALRSRSLVSSLR
jgi:DNA mismatch endonuclease, patch repair protein